MGLGPKNPSHLFAMEKNERASLGGVTLCSLAVCNCALSYEGITTAFRAAPANSSSGQRSPFKNTTYAESFCCFQKMTRFFCNGWCCCCCCCCCCCFSVGVIVLYPVAKISSLNFLNACCFVTGKTTSVRRRLLAEIIWTKLPKHWNS